MVNEQLVQGIWSAYRNGEVWAKEALIKEYLPLVRRTCARLAISLPSYLDRGDLEGAAALGLLEALDAFDPERGVRFETYAVARIRGAAIDSLRKLDFIPRSVRLKAKRLQQATETLLNRLGRYPDDSEIAQELGIAAEDLNKWWQETQAITLLSLNQPLGPDEQAVDGINALPGMSAEEPLQLLLAGEEWAGLTEAIEELLPRERLLLTLYYYEGLTLKELGQVLEISESRASQLHSAIMQKLRARLRLSGGVGNGKGNRRAKSQI